MFSSASDSLLPDGFADLAPFVDAWAVEEAAARAARRGESRAADRQAFYEAAKSRLADALSYLDQRPLASFSEQDKRLMNLMLSFGHVALAIEIQGPDEDRHARLARHMRIVRTAA